MDALPPIGFRQSYDVVGQTTPGLHQAMEHYRSKDQHGYVSYLPPAWDGMMLTEARFVKCDETPRDANERDRMERRQLEAFACMKRELYKLGRKPAVMNPGAPTERRALRKLGPVYEAQQRPLPAASHSQAVSSSGSGGVDHWHELAAAESTEERDPKAKERRMRRMQRLRDLESHGRPFDIVTGASISICRPRFDPDLFVQQKALVHPSLIDFGWKRGWWK